MLAVLRQNLGLLLMVAFQAAPLLARNGSCLNPIRAPAAVERAALWGSYIPGLDDSLDRTTLSETEKTWLTASRIAKVRTVVVFMSQAA